MAGRPRKKSADTATETRESLDAKVAAFLEAGGNIEVIPTGVSGQTNSGGTKHISLGNKK